MSYNSTTKVITAPVSIHDVQQALNESTTDLGYLCKSNKINIWSRNKPIRFDKITPVTDAERLRVNYGIKSPTLGRGLIYLGSLVKAALQGTGNIWEYEYPRGNYNGTHEWFRLSDFAGYKHNAQRPFSTAINGTGIPRENNTYKIDKTGVSQLSFVFMQPTSNDELNIMQMLGNMDGYRLVADIYTDTQWNSNSLDSVTPQRITSEEIQPNTTSVSITLNPTEFNGTYHICLGLQRYFNNQPEESTAVLAPCTSEEAYIGTVSYYYKVEFFENYEHRFEIQSVGYGSYGGGDFTYNSLSGNWEAPYNTNEWLFVKVRVNKGSIPLYFADEHMSVSGTRLKLKFELRDGRAEIAKPASETRGQLRDPVLIPSATGSSTEYEDVYALAQVLPPDSSSGITPTRNVPYQIVMKAVVGESEAWQDAGGFFIKYT